MVIELSKYILRRSNIAVLVTYILRYISIDCMDRVNNNPQECHQEGIRTTSSKEDVCKYVND